MILFREAALFIGGGVPDNAKGADPKEGLAILFVGMYEFVRR